MEAGRQCFLYSELELIPFDEAAGGGQRVTWYTALNMAN
jgi:hypothetical protein